MGGAFRSNESCECMARERQGYDIRRCLSADRSKTAPVAAACSGRQERLKILAFCSKVSAPINVV